MTQKIRTDMRLGAANGKALKAKDMNDRLLEGKLPRDPAEESSPSTARFGSVGAMPADEFFDGVGEPAANRTRPPYLPPKIGSLFEAALERMRRRGDGAEKPIVLPWPVLASHFGGGLWPGLHLLVAGTGVGKSQFALQVAAHTAKAGRPALYIGLELGETDLALRVLGEEAHVPWSRLYTGEGSPAHQERVRQAAPKLLEIPFHHEIARPHGFPPSELARAIEGVRAAYPEPDGPGSLPMLVVVDFLQLVGDETGQVEEVRTRVSRASYVLRELANRLQIAILCISSVAREKYATLNRVQTEAGLEYQEDNDGCPIERRILNTDVLVGMGKESGDLEYSADSVSVLARVAATWDGTGADFVFCTAKGRATGSSWSPLRFTGFRFEECSDRGGRLVEAWKSAAEKREQAKVEKLAAKDLAKAERTLADVDAVRAFVRDNPQCSVRQARANVGNNAPRWDAAVAALGRELVQSKVGQKIQLTLALTEEA